MADNPVETDEEARGSLPEGALVGGRFRIERLIGRGGMGEVYAARHAATGKEVALKLIRSAQASGKDHVRRFMREARAATAIQHPNVIEVYDVFADAEGTPVMVMELLKGEPFSRYRQRAGALKLHEAAAVLLPAARALRAAHDKGIVHRDLKPDNVFLAETPAGRTTKLLDFGIAKVLDPAKLSSETQGQQTNTGSILGTPHYMSFEQAMSDKTVDHRTDIWALGVMLFEALTGRRPLTYDTLGQMYAALLQGSVPSIREFVPDLPADMADVLDRCLAKERDGRLADLTPLIEVLERYADPRAPGAMSGGVVVEAPVKPPGEVTAAALSASVGGRAPGPRRSRTPLAIAVVAIAAAGLGAGIFLARRGPSGATGVDVVAPLGPATTAVAPATASPPPPAASPPPPAASSVVAVAPAAAPLAASHASHATTVTPAAASHPQGPADPGAPHASPPPAATKQGIVETPPY